MTSKIRTHRDLEVYGVAFEAAMGVFVVSGRFPREEACSPADQVRRSSRSVCANLAEAWRNRRHAAAFASKLSDAEAEAAETQVRIEFAVRCGSLDRDEGAGLYRAYDRVIATIVGMITHPDTGTLRR